MDVLGFVKLLNVMCILQCAQSAEMNGCRCSNEDEATSCHCEGSLLYLYNHFPGETINKLSLENGDFSYFLHNDLTYFKESLVDLTVTRSQELTKISRNVLLGMPALNCFIQNMGFGIWQLKLFMIFTCKICPRRITHTSLQNLPRIEGMGMVSTMRIIDFESNKIKKISSNTLSVRVAQLFLDYNSITSVDGWAFNGSEIEKLSFKGNYELSELSNDAFNGIRSLRDLDLSETSITFLPTLGLERLEILRIMDTLTLKIIPSIYDLSSLQVAHLTYSFHCCAFHNPEKHDPERHLEYMYLRKKYCKEDLIRSERDMFGELFDEVIGSSEESFFNTSNLKEMLQKQEMLGNEMIQDANYEGNNDETFHQTTAVVQKTKIHAICGSLTGKNISCFPKADALNPCEDMMSWTWLRISVWFVMSTAIFGNVSVLIVLCLSRSERSVPRYLMCNLAFADLVMAVYLGMLAIMDVISSETYFNYAYDWQRGIGCKIAGFLTVFASQLSLYTLSVLTIERWFAIRHALFLNMLDLKLTGNVMMVGWVFSIFIAALPLFGISSYSSTSICLPMDTHNGISQAYIILMVTLAGCSFVLMCVCYIQIYLSLSEETRHSVGESSVARKMTILVGTNFICWAPVAFFTLTAVMGYPLITVSQSKILLVFIYPINSCANPYLYAILTQQFRKDFMTIVSRYVNCKQSYNYKIGYAGPTRNDTVNDTRPPTTTETLL